MTRALYRATIYANKSNDEDEATTAERRIVNTLNPFRYRGYYYDTETGLYYLQSRYYNPQWGRFLNADGYVNANGDLVGFNMYAYCSNNPVMHADPTGESITLTVIAISVCAVVGFIDEFKNWKDSGEEFSTVHFIKIALATVGGGLSAYLGPVGGATVSFLTSLAISGFSGNDKKTAILDGLIGAASSCLGSLAAFGVGKVLAKRFIGKASGRALKLFARSLGYKGHLYKEAASWTSDMLTAAAITYMDKPLALGAEFLASTIFSAAWNRREDIRQCFTS